MEKEVTGVMMYYYKICPRKLWYFYHEIQMEHQNENVLIGKLIDENRYNRETKHINIDNVINIDFIRSKKTLHEVKKSRKIEKANILQVQYYLYYLKQRGVEGIKAQIDYPLLKQTVEVTLNDDDVREIEKKLSEIEKIVDGKQPPALEKKRICKACAFHDLCYI